MDGEIIKGSPLGPRPVEVSAVSDDALLVVFDTGESRVFDMGPYFQFPAFQQLKDPSLFKQPHIAFGSVVWPGGIDICPELIYEKGRRC